MPPVPALRQARFNPLAALLPVRSMKASELEDTLNALGKSQAIIEFDTDGTVRMANENFLNTMGYRLDEIKGQHHRLFVDPAYAASSEYHGFWDSLRRGQYQQAEYKRFGKDGREIWIQASYNPIFNKRGELVKIVKVATETTSTMQDRRRNEGMLSALDRSQAIIEFGLDGMIIGANENFLGALGYRLDEIKGQHHRMFVDPTYAASVEYRAFWDKLGRGEFDAGQYKRFGKGNTEIWIQASYNPILDQNGRPFRVVKFATDITAQVRRQLDNERLGGEINTGLQEIGSSLAAATTQADGATEASRETASMVQMVASAAEELSSSVREIATSITSSKAAVDQAVEQTAVADSCTQTLNETAQSMGGIVETIQEITAQINLLALNATIESARAGEAGKGFAVVANEVKSLASQVKAASQSIARDIDNMQNVTTSVVSALGCIKQSMDTVSSSVAGVAGAVEEQNAVTVDISRNMQSAATAVNSVDTNIGVIAQAIQSISSATQQVQANTNDLVRA